MNVNNLFMFTVIDLIELGALKEITTAFISLQVEPGLWPTVSGLQNASVFHQHPHTSTQTVTHSHAWRNTAPFSVFASLAHSHAAGIQ